MAKKRVSRQISEYMAAMGKKGGAASKGKTGIKKGFAAMDPERRREIAVAAVKAKRKKNQANEK